ncbi:Utp21 specific WD40 associated putative domain-containing protein [Cladochytrium replicatum]|nr:Utp21 specific WD40 associated putative domain-containing protein [Cladochytrium replicatum]
MAKAKGNSAGQTQTMGSHEKTLKKQAEDMKVTKKPSYAVPGRLYVPYRALGYITNDVPVCVQNLGTAYFLATCIGRSFQIYNCEKMNLLFVGTPTSEPITALAAHKELTFVASGAHVLTYRRGKELSRMTAPSKTQVISVIFLGEVILALGLNNTLFVWKLEDGELVSKVELGESFNASCMMHPSTYINKVLVGSHDGVLQLWNIRTMRLLYQFPKFHSPITCLEQSPVVDVVGIGLLDGTIAIHNVRTDERLMTFRQEGKVTGISFRTDERTHMATGSMSGDLHIWDLEAQRLVHTVNGAHDGTITSVHFFTGQALLLTAGSDNSVKQWLFDPDEDEPRLLKSRTGHHSPPTFVRFYGPEGKIVLSAGRDRSLRLFSVVRDAQNCELSQGSIERKSKKLKKSVDDLKLPQILKFAASPAKQKEWDNIITCHANQWEARLWSFQRKAIGKMVISAKDNQAIRAVGISVCGNFGFVGSAAGQVDMYNMQSGLHRRTFGRAGGGHTKAVVGICCDNLNRVLTTASLDGTLKFWDMKNGKVIETLDLSSPVVQMEQHPENELMAIVTDDLCLRVVDQETKRVIREFWAHKSRITDIAFSPDGRWLVTSALDGYVRTFDLPTAHHVDSFYVDQVVTSLSFSPTGEFLVTTHVDQVGLFLWANRSFTQSVSLRKLEEDEDAPHMDLPGVVVTAAEESADKTDRELAGDAVDPFAGFEDTNETDEVVPPTNTANENSRWVDDDVVASAGRASDGMIMTSTLPKSRWQNLLSLDEIKKRNKPKAPPKAPERAPFFLPPLSKDRFVLDNVSKDDKQAEDRATKKQTLNFESLEAVSKFVILLRQGRELNDYTEFIKHIKTLPPSATDLEIRTLPLENDFQDLKSMLSALQSILESGRDFELAEAYLAVTLKVHGDVIIQSCESASDVGMDLDSGVAEPDSEDGLDKYLNGVLAAHEALWTRLGERFRVGLCLVDFSRFVR